VNHLRIGERSDNDVLDCIERNYKKFLSIKAKATKEEFNQLCEEYRGFGYFGQLVELQQKRSGAYAPLWKDYSLSLSLGNRN